MAGKAALWPRLAAGLIAVGAWVIILWLDLAERHRLWLLIAFTVAGLFGVNYVGNLAPRQPYPPLQVAAVQSAVRAVDGSVPGRVHNEDVLFEDYGMFVGVEDVSGSSPLRLARYDALLTDFPASGCGGLPA